MKTLFVIVIFAGLAGFSVLFLLAAFQGLRQGRVVGLQAPYTYKDNKNIFIGTILGYIISSLMLAVAAISALIRFF